MDTVQQLKIYLAGHVPYIRCPKGNAAEMIARKLETKIRDAILTSARSPAAGSSNALFAQDSSGLSTLQRPRKPKNILHAVC